MENKIVKKESESLNTSLDQLIKDAEGGDADAQWQLGDCYWSGYKWGAELNENKALKWYEKSASRGNADRKARLGIRYYQSRDNEKSVKWLTEALNDSTAPPKIISPENLQDLIALVRYKLNWKDNCIRTSMGIQAFEMRIQGWEWHLQKAEKELQILWYDVIDIDAVGFFWITGGGSDADIIFDKGSHLNSLESWNELSHKQFGGKYSYYALTNFPRGRVMYDCNTGKTFVYADKKILNRLNIFEPILADMFSLKDYEFRYDKRYKSSIVIKKSEGFLRVFNRAKLNNLTGKNAELFERLKADVYTGEVFPAVRKGEIHFYYKGGCLYKFNGVSFVRDKEYEKYSDGTAGLDEYDKAKKQNENKYKHADGSAKEQQLLHRLNGHTFNRHNTSGVVVLDIETRLNGAIGSNKKCDMVLLNTTTNQIMFVEGKVFTDGRVNVKVDYMPEVIEQVKTYTAAIAEQAQTIVAQYGEHIKTINALFGTAYDPQIRLTDTAKLLVYGTPQNPNLNGQYSIKTISDGLGTGNVAWFKTGEEPSIDEIWSALCK
jgi:hypothetical protein